MRLVSAQVAYLFTTFTVLVSSQKNNVCKSFKDYYTIENNTNCYYDPAAEHEAPELIRLEGYPLETHKIVSSDGYILTLFRLPNVENHHSNGYSVFLQHGILSNGVAFLGLGKDSLPYVLWDAGYDVWIGNYRGTYYSEGHVNLTVYDKEYWDHSVDELGTIDVPLTMKFIAQTTGTVGNIYYIGYSLGASMALIYASEYQEEAAKYVRMFVFMGPVYVVPNMVSPYKVLILNMSTIAKIVTNLDLYRLLGQSRPLRDGAQIVCLESPVLMQLCEFFQNLFFGLVTGVGTVRSMSPYLARTLLQQAISDSLKFVRTALLVPHLTEKLPVFYNQSPGGTSPKIWVHAGAFTAGYFTKFDYGVDNLRKYGTLKPPPYDITKIKVPVHILHGNTDWLVVKKDALNLYNTLPPGSRYGIREISGVPFTHLDFLMGPHAKELVYDHIINLLNTFPNKVPFI